MNQTGYDSSNFVMSYLDIIPAVIMVVDEDVRIHNMNRYTSQKFKLSALDHFLMKGGDAFGCINSFDSEEGCGHGEECKSCVIRNSVKTALIKKETLRNYKRLVYKADDQVFTLECLITTSLILYEGSAKVLLVIEDIGELVALRRLIPICSGCKKVRNDAKYWVDVEEYIHNSIQLDFSHGLCPECIAKYYPNLSRKFKNQNAENTEESV